MNLDMLDLAMLRNMQETTAYIEEANADIIRNNEKTSEIVLNRQLDDAAELNWARHALGKATHDALKFLVEELAKARKEDAEDVLASYHRLRTILFNRELNNDLQSGYVKNDPRNPASDNSKVIGPWYDRSIDPGM